VILAIAAAHNKDSRLANIVYCAVQQLARILCRMTCKRLGGIEVPMTKFNYASGFMVAINVIPVARKACDIGKAPAIHARVMEDFSFGPFNCEAGQLLCRSNEEIACYPVSKPINSVSCARCRWLLDRWSREALLSRCKGFALSRDGSTRAVAAKSTAMASQILGIGNGVLVRCGINKIVLGPPLKDGLDHIRKALQAHEYGTVLRLLDGETKWELEQSPARAEELLREHMLSYSERGNTRVELSELQRNRSIRLTPFESEALSALGGAAWVRQRIDHAKKSYIADNLEAPTVNRTIRTTDAQWDKVRIMGGYTWIRSMIHRAMKAQEQDLGA
jgi:hypothetical protein